MKDKNENIGSTNKAVVLKVVSSKHRNITYSVKLKYPYRFKDC